MSDPVAAKSTFLCMYMSNHPDTLVSYVRHYAHIPHTVSSAQLSSISSTGMTLTYATTAQEKNTVVVPFDPPLKGYDEVKGRMMQMKAEAEEALGMMKAPHITSFTVPPGLWRTALMMLALIYTTFSPSPSSSPFDLPWVPVLVYPATWIRTALPSGSLAWIWGFMISVHALESLYTLSLCRKHHTGVVVGAMYVLATFAFGFPVFVDFRKRVQAIRIDSIMKGK
ncbi:hypothetical protein EW026_g5322 [Hermanssonia centrifuga]|uniref:DUF2470 domain-containing protein n=1 Tax=Hermanssonia centrifuga TaxID=98765 RepID=A0A4S4KEF5_9APHY|nr:hypothetical protein EW026_g5322 [Hermanssonia centrifuga]